MLPIVAKMELKLKAAKIEAYIIFHPRKSTVPCTSPSQISEIVCGKTLNIWHDLRSSFWKHLLRRCPYLISFEHLLSCIGFIWERVLTEGCWVVRCQLLQVAGSVLDTFTHLHNFFHQYLYKQPSPGLLNIPFLSSPQYTQQLPALCGYSCSRCALLTALMSVNWKQNTGK